MNKYCAMERDKNSSKMAVILAIATVYAVSVPLNGSLAAPIIVDDCHEFDHPNATDPETISGLMQRAEAGEASNQYKLGEAYERYGNGFGCDDDRDKYYKMAFEWYKRSAEQGYADAQFHLGDMYAEGKGVKKDPLIAVEWFQNSATQSDKYTLYLGSEYEIGSRIPRNSSKAIELYRKLADKGHADAQERLGRIYEQGELVRKDLKQAMEWYQKAADQERSSAQYHLGLMYKNGIGVTKSAPKAAELFQKAAEKNNSNAQFDLGLMYENGEGVQQDSKKAFYWFRKYAEPWTGFFRSIGEMYENGDRVKKNAQKADEWYRIASEWVRRNAESGDFNAQDDFGWMYEEGKGMPRDLEKAVEWYRRSADQGAMLPASRINGIAKKYKNGIGVPKDAAYAAKLFQTSAEYGDSDAQFNLAVMYDSGVGVPKSAAKAVAWYTKAAEHGDVDAQYTLGLIYGLGDGVPKDLVMAYAWLNLAASDPTLDSKRRKSAIYSRDNEIAVQMSPGQIAEAQKLSANWKKGDALTRATYRPSGGDTDKQVAQKSVDSSALTPNTPTAQTPTRQMTGTAFFVSSEGHAVTNFHIVNGCKEITTEGKATSFRVVTTDGNNDLALLRLADHRSEAAVLPSEASKLRQGEEIVVFGYPLNTVLSSGGNLTPGVISALTGVKNNTSQIQITAPIQPGSSGSPVLDKRGNVVGVVAMKLSDSVMAETMGTLGQNINFAVSGQTLVSFLEAHQVQYKRNSSWFARDKSLVDLADQARKWTVVVECWK